jgi:hypothetical protein
MTAIAVDGDRPVRIVQKILRDLDLIVAVVQHTHRHTTSPKVTPASAYSAVEKRIDRGG